MEINLIDMTGGTPRESTITLPNLPAWTMAAEIGYEPQTTFWQDFCIAELYGDPTPIHGIIDTYRRAFKEWRDDVTYIAELSLVLNHRGCFWHSVAGQHNEECFKILYQVYFNLWENLHDWARENYTGDDAQYYFNVTD